MKQRIPASMRDGWLNANTGALEIECYVLEYYDVASRGSVNIIFGLSCADEELVLAIEEERRVELAFEKYRRFDLVRTGCAKIMMLEKHKLDGYPDFIWSDDGWFTRFQ